jgi:hypothetical protein
VKAKLHRFSPITFFCSGEIIEKTLTLPGALPPPLGHPPYRDNLIRSTRISEMGVKGMHPLGCLPLGGREGVTLFYTKEGWHATGKRGFLQAVFFNALFLTII